MALFANVPKEAPDPIQELNKRLAADTTRVKVDLGAGVYRNEDGEYHQLSVIRKVKLVSRTGRSFVSRSETGQRAARRIRSRA